jgi:hypothetical protein
VVENKTKGINIEVMYGLTARQKQIILAGGSLSMQRKKA